MSEVKKESKLGSIIGTAVLAVTCAVVGFIACQLMPKGGAAGQGKMDPRKLVGVVAVTNGEVRAYNLPQKYVAHAEPMQEVALIPQVDGYIKEICFKEGDLVKEGQVLYILDDEKYQAVVGQAKADLAAAEAEARRAIQYNERMVKADDRGVTQLERDNAFAAAEKAKAAVLQAKANLVVAEYNCKKAKIYAPFSGKIGKTSKHIGDLVSPSTVLATVIEVDPIRVSFPMTDRAFTELMKLKDSGKVAEMRMRLLLPDGSEYDQQGEWDFDDNRMSATTASMMMRAKFANPKGFLVPDAYVTLLTDFCEPPKYLAVPQQCVVDLTGGSLGVWVVGDDMTVSPRPVKTLEQFEGWVPVVEGLKAGEKVVLSGVGKLMAGQKVSFSEATSNDDINPDHQSRLKAE